jgi:hypothetical protein
MRVEKLEEKDLECGKIYKIGDIECSLIKRDFSENYFFNNPGGSNTLIYLDCGVTRKEVDDFIGIDTHGVFPELSLPEIAKLYNWLNDKWRRLNNPPIELDEESHIIFPHEVQSQEDWDSLWPKLKKVGFTWSDGEEITAEFSECHDFPQHIENHGDIVTSKRITISD